MWNLANQRFNRVVLLAGIILGSCGVLLAQSGYIDTAAHTKVGDPMPAISVHEISGATFSSAQDRGKVIVVNFWATWCGPCQVEMPQLEKNIWDKYKSNSKFAMVAIARQQTKNVVEGFKQHHPYTFPLAYDPDRSTYKLFADSGIPRTYVVGKHGKIVFQSVGYDPQEFGLLDQAIQRALRTK